MANFPSVVPSARTYIPGSFASSTLSDMNGTETNIRHSSASYGHQLKLRFKSLPRADYENILNHYIQQKVKYSCAHMEQMMIFLSIQMY